VKGFRLKLLHQRRVKIFLILFVLLIPLTYVSSQEENGSQEKSTTLNKPANIAGFVNSQIRKGKLFKGRQFSLNE